MILVLAFLFNIVTINCQCSTAVPTFEDGKTPSREIFVSATAPAGGSGTQQSPYNSITTALQAATPGTAIRILATGTYSGFFSNGLAGNSTHPIWFGGTSAQSRAVFNGQIQMSQAKWLIVQNIEVGNVAASNGMNFDDGSNYASNTAAQYLIFKNLFIHDIGSTQNLDGLKLSGINNYYVLDSTFQAISSGGSAIDHVGCHNGVIARNTFISNGNAVQSKGGSENIDIKWNTFRQHSGRALNMGGSTGFEFFRPPLSTTTPNFEARNIRALANTFDNDAEPIAIVGCDACIVAHNTIRNPTTRIFRVLQETTTSGNNQFIPCRNAQIFNNLISFSTSSVINADRMINVGANTSPATFTWSNNLWYGTPINQITPAYNGATTTGEIYRQDPQFTTFPRISTQSVAVGGGRSQSAIQIDYYGTCYASPPTIGAVEASSVTPSQPSSQATSQQQTSNQQTSNQQSSNQQTSNQQSSNQQTSNQQSSNQQSTDQSSQIGTSQSGLESSASVIISLFIPLVVLLV